jgi:hypothetical protein
LGFWGNFSRRGTHVSVPKIGSRGACFCFGGILGVYADLRREIEMGGIEIGCFWNLGGVLTWGWRRGGQLVFKELCVLRFCGWIMGG